MKVNHVYDSNLIAGFVLYGTYGFQNSAQDMEEKIPLLSSSKNNDHRNHHHHHNPPTSMNKTYGGVLENYSVREEV